jgi:hypothetical protein
MQRKIKQLGAIVAALLIALGLLYPILFPVGCLLVAGLILLLGTRWGHGLPQYTRRDLALLSIGLGVSLVIFFGYLELVTQDRVKSTFQFTVHEMQMLSKGFHLLSALLPLALVASPFVIKSVRNRSSSAILLAATALGLMVLYIFANLTNLEYKLIFGATIFLFPLSAAGLDPLFLRSPRWRWFWAMAVPLLLIAIHLLLMYRVGARLPRNLANAPTLHEGSFWIALDQDEQDAAWIQTVRNATPEETILVARDSQIHLGPFVFRSLYLPSDADGVATAGYSVPNDYNMLEWRGYSAELYRQRLEVVDTIYRERDPTKLTHALTALRRLNRPVAIHFSDDRAPALAWLKQQAIGCALFADDRDTVWFIHSAESDCSTPTAVTQ